MKIFICSLFAVIFIGVSACTSTSPTFGDRLAVEGESRIKVSKQWEEGKNESIKGEKTVLKGRKLVEKGRADLREGEGRIASGNLAVQENREAYQALSQAAQGVVSGEVASDRASKLRKIAKKWEDAEALIVEGSELIRRGNDRISEGELEIRNGQNMIELGRSKMQDAESRYLP